MNRLEHAFPPTLKRSIKNTPILFRLSSHLLGKSVLPLVTKETDLCLEGPPRCANTFCGELLNQFSPNLKIVQHTHAIANVKIALRNDIPVVILIRNPIDAIVSNLIRERSKGFTIKSIKYYCSLYADFFDFIANYHAEFSVMDFELVTNQPDKFLQHICQTLNIHQPLPSQQELNAMTQNALVQIERRNLQVNPSSLTSGSPSLEKHKRKEDIRAELQTNSKKSINVLMRKYETAKEKCEML